jgi:hypothetical protein
MPRKSQVASNGFEWTVDSSPTPAIATRPQREYRCGMERPCSRIQSVIQTNTQTNKQTHVDELNTSIVMDLSTK